MLLAQRLSAKLRALQAGAALLEFVTSRMSPHVKISRNGQQIQAQWTVWVRILVTVVSCEPSHRAGWDPQSLAFSNALALASLNLLHTLCLVNWFPLPLALAQGVRGLPSGTHFLLG